MCVCFVCVFGVCVCVCVCVCVDDLGVSIPMMDSLAFEEYW